MHLYVFIGNVQPDAASCFFLRLGHLVEPLEDVFLVSVGDARPIVGDADAHMVVFLIEVYIDFAFVWCVLEGI